MSPNNPVLLHRVWNKLTCNSAALEAAGIDRNTPDPPQGVAYSGSFDRDEHGEPTGLFRDRAKDLIANALPAKTDAEYARAVAVGSQHYNASGITAVGEPGLYPVEVHGFHQAHLNGELTVRTDMMLAGWGFGSVEEEADLENRFRSIGVMTGFGDDMLRIGGVKFMPDGGIGDRTAKVFEPYEGEPENRGQWIVEPAELTRLIRFVHDLGFAIDTHTCGDEAQASDGRSLCRRAGRKSQTLVAPPRASRLSADRARARPDGRLQDPRGRLQSVSLVAGRKLHHLARDSSALRA